MFAAVLAGGAASSPWIDVHAIPENLIEGVITTFVGLIVLFSIKPRLKVELLPVPRKASDANYDPDGDQRSEMFRFRVTNRRLRKVVDVRARLLFIRRAGPRQEIRLVHDELFELRGKWSPIKPSGTALLRAYLERMSSNESNHENAENRLTRIRSVRKRDKANRAHYTFYPIRGELEEKIARLGEEDFVLFQVAAKNAFTGFGRLKIARFYKPEMDDVAERAALRQQKSSIATATSD